MKQTKNCTLKGKPTKQYAKKKCDGGFSTISRYRMEKPLFAGAKRKCRRRKKSRPHYMRRIQPICPFVVDGRDIISVFFFSCCCADSWSPLPSPTTQPPVGNRKSGSKTHTLCVCVSHGIAWHGIEILCAQRHYIICGGTCTMMALYQ